MGLIEWDGSQIVQPVEKPAADALVIRVVTGVIEEFHSENLLDCFRAFRPGVARLVAEQLLCRAQVVEPTVSWPARRVQDDEGDVGRGLRRAGEETPGI